MDNPDTTTDPAAQQRPDAPRPGKRGLLAAAAVGLSGLIAGGVLAASFSASAADNSNTPNPGRPPAIGHIQGDPSKPMRSDETLLTGTTKDKVTSAVKAKYPSATFQRVETDSEGVYEAHMVRTDGTQIIVQVDKSFAVTNVQTMGQGGPGGAGAQGAPGANGQPPSGAPSGSATSGTSANG